MAEPQATACRTRLGFRRPHKIAFVSSANLAGHQSYRYGRCVRCEGLCQQSLSWGGRPNGPWIEDVKVPCTHGVGGAALLACMRCAVERSNRGLK